MGKRITSHNLTFLNLGKHPLSAEQEVELLTLAMDTTNPIQSIRAVRPLFDGSDETLRRGLESQLAAAPRPPSMLVCALPASSCADFALAHGIPFVWSLPTFALISPVASSLPYVPTLLTRMPYARATMWQRLVNLLPQLLFKVVFHVVGWPTKAIRDTVANLPGHLVLVPGVPGLDYPQHTPPLVQYTGPYLSAKDSNPALLAEDVRAWLDQPGAAPVLYISMGTIVQLTSHLCQVFLEAVRAAAAAGEFRALWALPAHQHGCLGPDRAQDLRGPAGPLLISPWVPTPAALAHPAVRVFLSHCGANGASESVWARVPILGLPFVGDQLDVAHRVEDLGFGLRLDRWKVTAGDIRAGALRLIAEPRFAAAAEQVSHVMKVYGGVGRAADLVEMVHNLGGDLSFLETAADRQGILKAYCLDLVLAATGLLALGCFICGRRSARVTRPASEGRTKRD